MRSADKPQFYSGTLSHFPRWLLSLGLLALSVNTMAGFTLGPTNQSWASKSAPVRMNALLSGDRNIIFNPRIGAGIPQTFCSYAGTTVKLGLAQIQTANAITATMSGSSNSAVIIVKVVLRDTRNYQNTGERLYYFYRDNPVIVTADDFVTYGPAGSPTFTNVVTNRARYMRVGVGLTPYLNPQPTVYRMEEISKPAGSTSLTLVTQCQWMQAPFLGRKQCKALTIQPDIPGKYVVRFTLSDVSGGASEGYWITWTHNAFSHPY